MIYCTTICLYRLRHTVVAAATPALISRATICLYRLRHTAVAAAALAMISRAPRRSTAIAIDIVRNRSCDATAAATVQHCRRSSKQLRHIAVAAVAPAMTSRVFRRSIVVAIAIVRNRSCVATAAATVQHCRRRSKQHRNIAVTAVAPAIISRVLRRSTVVVIVIVRNRSYDATAAATVQHCRRSSSQPHAPSLALSGARGTTAATVQRRRNISTAVATTATVPTRVRSSSTDAAPTVARGTVRHFRSSSQAPFSSFGWAQRYACRDGPTVNGLANSIAHGQAQRDVEMDCHGGPFFKVSGPPETTASLARRGPPLQARHQRRLQPPSGTLSSPTVDISDSAFEQWLQSDNMEMPMFSQLERPQQSAPTAVTLAAAAPAAEAVTGTRVYPAVSSKGVAEAPASSAGAALAAVPAAAPATGGTVFPTASVGGRPGRPLLQME